VYVPFPFEAEVRHWHSQFVVDISDTIDVKVAAVRAYESQFDAARFARVEHMIRSTGGYHGARCGYMYGELFALPTPVGAPDLVTLGERQQGDARPAAIPGKDHLPLTSVSG
jgi:LmbE family N-acetylglucosaminyl deacetylase